MAVNMWCTCNYTGKCLGCNIERKVTELYGKQGHDFLLGFIHGNDVKRIYPGGVNGLINWMEENFHDIDSYVVTFRMKDKTTMTVHHTESYFDALAIAAFSLDTIQKMGEEFVPSKEGEP